MLVSHQKNSSRLCYLHSFNHRLLPTILKQNLATPSSLQRYKPPSSLPHREFRNTLYHPEPEETGGTLDKGR